MLGFAKSSFKTSTFIKVAVMLAFLAALPSVTFSDECIFPDEPAKGQASHAASTPHAWSISNKHLCTRTHARTRALLARMHLKLTPHFDSLRKNILHL